MNWTRELKRGILAGLILLTTGCVTADPPPQMAAVSTAPAPDAPMPVPAYAPPRPAEGSVWTAGNRFLFDDAKAAYVGDTIIVDIVETSSSTLEVNSKTSKDSSREIGVPTLNLFGYSTNLGGTAGNNLIETKSAKELEGKASSDRSGQVTASIAARVTEVLPNGNLSIFGRRAMKVDNEVQYIVVSGIIRPDDISGDNRVESTAMADARIEYYGKGELANSQKPGWGSKLIDAVWPW